MWKVGAFLLTDVEPHRRMKSCSNASSHASRLIADKSKVADGRIAVSLKPNSDVGVPYKT